MGRYWWVGQLIGQQVDYWPFPKFKTKGEADNKKLPEIYM